MPKIVQLKDNDGFVYPKTLEKNSTEEQVIGKWIDGSKVYRKIIYVPTINMTTIGFKYVAHGISNLKSIVNLKYIFGDNTIFFQSFNSAISALGANSTNIRMYCGVAWDNIPDWYFSIDYIKTS